MIAELLAGVAGGKHLPGEHDQRRHGRRVGGAAWGATHTGSRDMTGASAGIMGLPGWDQRFTDRTTERNARNMLRAIRDARPRKRPLYHGERITPARLAGMTVGAEIDLPLTATSRDRGMVEGYARPSNAEAIPRVSVVLEFAPGVRARTYHEDEAITAGRFRVARVTAADPIATFNYDRQDWDYTPVTRVVLEQVAVFDPDSPGGNV